MVGENQQKQLLSWVGSEPDLTLAQLQLTLDQQAGVAVSQVAIWRWMKRLGLRLNKKSLHAQERDTEANLERHREFLKVIAAHPRPGRVI